MKKHVVWFDFMFNDRASFVFSWVMNFCMERQIEFNATYGEIRGRLEFECDKRDWDQLVFSCMFTCNYPLTEEKSL